MRVFAVGATGVLGRRLVPLLTARGHKVTAMAPDRLDSLPEGIPTVRAGLLDSGLDLRAQVEGHDAVVNLATSMPRDPSAAGAWRPTGRIRSVGTGALVEAARAAGVRRLVQMSITMAYADGGDGWLAEDALFDADPRRREIVDPVAEMERAVSAVPPTEVAWCLLRGARFAGPGTAQDTQCGQLARGELRIPGDGRAFVSMVHVVDYAAAVVAALERAPAGWTFNVADEPLRVGDYYTRLARATGCAPPESDGADESGIPSHRIDSTAARQKLGWHPARGIWPS
ncbi:NAD-dependent epimerase/dehydratase family protein [Streptomonospora alba]|uniref:NAD-dependent epimerase/dehydratase family protein n=1 Tax=Streptomonospora alba TaxID=183763 RepID=UPI00069BC691|nr:NAD(P)-dependent oxidoreductase [Streptomonospora alba]